MSEKKNLSSNFMKVMGLFSPHKNSQLLQLSNKYPNTFFDRDSWNNYIYSYYKYVPYTTHNKVNPIPIIRESFYEKISPPISLNI